MDVTAERFQREVIERSHEQPVVVDFWAGWCWPCPMLGPALEAEAAKRARRLELVNVDVDAEAQLSARYGIRSIPTVAVFRDGEPVTGFVGAQRGRVIGDFFDERVLGAAVEQPRADVRPAAETSRNPAVPTPARKEVS
ncbi:MAG: thioredoxin family protein [Solirubrobacteraceae bacterium]